MLSSVTFDRHLGPRLHCGPNDLNFNSDLNSIIMGREFEPKTRLRDLESAPSLDDVHLFNGTVDTLFWDDVSVRLPASSKRSEKYLLQYVGGDVKAGELIAIMGPSGSGKSTLLNVLAHRPVSPKTAAIGGNILINRAPASSATFAQAGCYVEQDDSLIGSLTTRETLDFAAKLSLPR